MVRPADRLRRLSKCRGSSGSVQEVFEISRDCGSGSGRVKSLSKLASRGGVTLTRWPVKTAVEFRSVVCRTEVEAFHRPNGVAAKKNAYVYTGKYAFFIPGGILAKSPDR